MKPTEIGSKYDKIAAWWDNYHRESDYGLGPIKNAIAFCENKRKALDVGCGSGGRIVKLLQNHGFAITGIDVSAEMIRLATANHKKETFIHGDITQWQNTEKFDFILAWDSIFHLPFNQHKPVIEKLSGMLETKGILVYTFGDAVDEHTSEWLDDTFYYSSIGVDGNKKTLEDCGLAIEHLQIDSSNEGHVYVVAKK